MEDRWRPIKAIRDAVKLKAHTHSSLYFLLNPILWLTVETEEVGNQCGPRVRAESIEQSWVRGWPGKCRSQESQNPGPVTRLSLSPGVMLWCDVTCNTGTRDTCNAGRAGQCDRSDIRIIRQITQPGWHPRRDFWQVGIKINEIQ